MSYLADRIYLGSALLRQAPGPAASGARTNLSAADHSDRCGRRPAECRLAERRLARAARPPSTTTTAASSSTVGAPVTTESTGLA